MPQSCSDGRGDHYIEHGGYTWRTLDRADPQGGAGDAPNDGCQCNVDTGFFRSSDHSCPSNYLPLPAGWVLAPNDATSIAVVAAHGWSTMCAVLADGSSWLSANNVRDAGNICGSRNQLRTSDGTYTVATCGARVLARCG